MAPHCARTIRPTRRSTPDVQSETGKCLARLPGEVSVRQIGGDWVLGVVVDADQVEHVRVYRLRRQ